jgi:hypothetical protein
MSSSAEQNRQKFASSPFTWRSQSAPNRDKWYRRGKIFILIKKYIKKDHFHVKEVDKNLNVENLLNFWIIWYHAV